MAGHMLSKYAFIYMAHIPPNSKARLRERMLEPAALAARARLTQKLRTTEAFRRCDDRTTAGTYARSLV